MKALCLLASLVSPVLFAGAFDQIKVEGHCNQSNTSIVENGMSLSVLFNELSANMPAGSVGDGRSVNKVCTFKVRISYPPDCFLSAIKQVFSGGVIKSKNTFGSLVFFSLIGLKPSVAPAMAWPIGQEITADSPSSLFVREAQMNLPQPASCSGKVDFSTRLALRAFRASIDGGTFIGGLDSFDSDLVQKLDIVPVWKPCQVRR